MANDKATRRSFVVVTAAMLGLSTAGAGTGCSPARMGPAVTAGAGVSSPQSGGESMQGAGAPGPSAASAAPTPPSGNPCAIPGAHAGMNAGGAQPAQSVPPPPDPPVASAQPAQSIPPPPDPPVASGMRMGGAGTIGAPQQGSTTRRRRSSGGMRM